MIASTSSESSMENSIRTLLGFKRYDYMIFEVGFE